MNCPYCSEEMIKGYIESIYDVHWTKKSYFNPIFSVLFDKDAVVISDRDSSKSATAYRCEKCKTVIVPYGENQK